MQDGGKVIYLRHAATNQNQVDTGRLGRSRRASAIFPPRASRRQRRLARRSSTLHIPMGQILASPVFRARDTGELAFGADRIEVTMDLVADDYAGPNLQGHAERNAAAAAYRHAAGR